MSKLTQLRFDFCFQNMDRHKRIRKHFLTFQTTALTLQSFHSFKVYNGAGSLCLQFTVHVMLFPMLNVLYFHFLRSMSTTSLLSCFPGMLLSYILNAFEMFPGVLLIVLLLLFFTFHMLCISIVRSLYFYYYYYYYVNLGVSQRWIRRMLFCTTWRHVLWWECT